MGKGCDQCFAEGGNVRSGKQRSDNEKGVHKASYANENEMGRSEAGEGVRDSRAFKSSYKKVKMGLVKDEHHKVLGELKALPKPKLEGLAKGGEVYSVGPMTDTRQPSKEALTAYEKGGDVDADGDMDADMDNEMLDMCCDELLQALESKNKKEILESLKAIILSVKG